MVTQTQKSLGDIMYWESLVGDVQPDSPIVLLLHGMMRDHSSLLYLLEDFVRPIRVIALLAPYMLSESLGGYGWFPDEFAFYDRPEAEQAPAIRAQADHIAPFVRQLRALYPNAKMAVVGFSQGGDIALSLAAYYPELFNLCIAVAGRLEASMRPARFDRPQSILPRVHLKQGLDDEYVSVAAAGVAAAWLISVGYRTDLHEYPDVKHVISREMAHDIRLLLAKL